MSLRAGGEQSLGRANQGAPTRGTHGRGHPGHNPPAHARTACFSRWGSASLARGRCPASRPAFPRGGREPLSPPPSEGSSEQPRGSPVPLRPCGQAWSQISATGPHAPLLSPSRQRGGAGHLEKKMSWKSGLRMRGGSPQPGSHRSCLLPPPRPPRLPTPPPAYLLRFRGFPPTWADATSSR